MEERNTKLLLPIKVREERLRGETRRDNKSLREQLDISPRLQILRRQDPTATLLMLSSLDLVLKANLVKDVKLLRVLGQILVNHMPGDVLPGLHAKRLRVHGEVWVLVRAEHVVALQPGIQTVLRPCSSDGGRGVQHRQRFLGMELMPGFRSCEAGPACEMGQ